MTSAQMADRLRIYRSCFGGWVWREGMAVGYGYRSSREAYDAWRRWRDGPDRPAEAEEVNTNGQAG